MISNLAVVREYKGIPHKFCIIKCQQGYEEVSIPTII
jgi:hypothetical protein